MAFDGIRMKKPRMPSIGTEQLALEFISSSIVPTIMAVTAGKMYGHDRLDLFYMTVTVGTILSSIASSLNYQFRTMSRSRNQLTILTSFLMTMTALASIVAFHLIRHNYSSLNDYRLPNSLRSHQKPNKVVPTNGSDVFRYHFFADFVPGLIIFSQTQFCQLINYDLLNRAKRKFTYGEASIVSQLISATYLVWALSWYSKWTAAGPFRVALTNDIVLNLGMIIFTIVFLPSYLLLKNNNNSRGGGGSTLIKYTLLTVALILSYLTSRNLLAHEKVTNPFYWLVDYIFATHQRISVFSLWLSTVVACISFSTNWTRMGGQTNSLVRKIFHLAICVVFITGYNQDLDFTRFAAGGMIVVMFLLEIIRVWNLWPIGAHLESVCHALRGKWDNRYLTVSHIYLLVGALIPLWLLPGASEPSKLLLSSGIISVGVGDTAAAIVGTFYGSRKFAGSEKTIEGLLGNFVAMAAFKLVWIGYFGFVDEFSFAMAAILTALTEIIANDCDNLVLPLVMILFLEIF